VLVPHHRARRVDWKVGLTFGALGAVSAGVGARLAQYINPTILLGGLTLLGGLAVAPISGNRAAGGVVLVLGGVVCARWMTREVGEWRTVVALVAVIGLFVVSHPLGRLIGAWPAVLVVYGDRGIVCYAISRPVDPG